MFYQLFSFRDAKCTMDYVVSSLSYNLTINEDFKSYVSLLIYSINLQGKDIKIQCEDGFASDFFSWLKPQIEKLEKLMCVNNP